MHHLEDILGAVAIAGLSVYASYALTKKLAAEHRHLNLNYFLLLAALSANT